jgi:hypothetical protein
MRILEKARVLPIVVGVLMGTAVAAWASVPAQTVVADSVSSARSCGSTICPSYLWLRAPVLRARTL